MQNFTLTYPPGTSFGGFQNTGGSYVGSSGGNPGPTPAAPGERLYTELGTYQFFWPYGESSIQVSGSGGGAGGGSITGGAATNAGGAGGGGGGSWGIALIPLAAIASQGELTVQVLYNGDPGEYGRECICFDPHTGGGALVCPQSGNPGHPGGVGAAGAGGKGLPFQIRGDGVVKLDFVDGTDGEAGSTVTHAGGAGGVGGGGGVGGAGGASNKNGAAGTVNAGGGGAGGRLTGAAATGGQGGPQAWLRISWPPTGEAHDPPNLS